MKNVELVMMSVDEEPEEALEWAKEESFPWPTVLFPEIESVTLSVKEDVGVSDYVLVDKHGKEITRGKEEILKKLETLKK